MAQVYKIDNKRYQFKEVDSAVQTSFLLSEEDHNKWIKINTEDSSVQVQLPEGLSNGFRAVIENTGVFTINYVNAAGTSIATQQDKFTEDQFRTIEAVYDNSVWRLQGYIGRQDLSSLYDVNVNAAGLPSDGDALVFDINSNVWRAGKNVPFIPADPFFLDHIITDEDHGKMLLFDTTAAPITVTFNLGLEDGLFVKLLNVGTGTLTVASAGTLNAAGTTLSQYQSMEVLHAASNVFYGVIAEGIGGTGGSGSSGGYSAGNYFETYIATSYTGLFPSTHESNSNSLALGTLARSFEDNQIVVGANSTADGQYDIVIGDQADGDGISIQKIVVGRQARATANNSIAFGFISEVTGSSGVAIGNAAKVFSPGSIQLGSGTNNESNTLNFLSSRIAHGFGINIRREDAENNTTSIHRFAQSTSDGGVPQHPTLATAAMSFPNKVFYIGTGTSDNSGRPEKQWVPINTPPGTDYLRSRFENNVTMSTQGSMYFPAGYESRLWTDNPTGASDNVNKEQWSTVAWVEEGSDSQVLSTPLYLYQANEPYFRKDDSSSGLTVDWRNRRVVRWVVTSNVAGLSNNTNGPFSIPSSNLSTLASLISKGDRVLFTGQTDNTENGIYRFDEFDGNFYVFNRPNDLLIGTSISTAPIEAWGATSTQGTWTPTSASTVGSAFTLSKTDSDPNDFGNRALYFGIKAAGYYRLDMRLRLQAVDAVTNPDARAIVTLKYLDNNTIRTKEVFRYNLFTKNSTGTNILKDIRLNETLRMRRDTYYFTIAFYDTPDIILFSSVTNDEYGSSYYEIIPQQLFEAPF